MKVFGSVQSIYCVMKHDFMEESKVWSMSIMTSLRELALRVLRLVTKFVAGKPVPSSGTVSEVMVTVPPRTCSKF